MTKIKKAIGITPNRYKAKPIFAEEKEFIESHLPQIAPIPNDCWISGGSTKTVFVDLYSSEYLFKFKVENGGKFILLKDNRSLFDFYEVYDNETKVMYVISDDYHNEGSITLLVDENGKPKLYKEN